MTRASRWRARSGSYRGGERERPVPVDAARAGVYGGEGIDGGAVRSSQSTVSPRPRDLLEGGDDDLGYAGEEKDVKQMRKDEGRKKRP